MLLFSLMAAQACRRRMQVEHVRDVEVPRLRLSRALPYASNRWRGLEPGSRQDVTLQRGFGILEIPFDGDIGVFDLRPSNSMPIPLAYTCGPFLRLFVALDHDARLDFDAADQAVDWTEACLNWHRTFWKSR